MLPYMSACIHWRVMTIVFRVALDDVILCNVHYGRNFSEISRGIAVSQYWWWTIGFVSRRAAFHWFTRLMRLQINLMIPCFEISILIRFLCRCDHCFLYLDRTFGHFIAYMRNDCLWCLFRSIFKNMFLMCFRKVYFLNSASMLILLNYSHQKRKLKRLSTNFNSTVCYYIKNCDIKISIIWGCEIYVVMIVDQRIAFSSYCAMVFALLFMADKSTIFRQMFTWIGEG